MKTIDINKALLGRKVKGIFTDLEVTGTIVGLVEEKYSKGVEIELDEPVNWGGILYERYQSTNRVYDEMGNLNHTILL